MNKELLEALDILEKEKEGTELKQFKFFLRIRICL